jgi:hypothetical protein
MAYIAQRALRWGDGYLEPGDPVPEEEGRSYASLLALGHIVEVKAAAEMSGEELVKHAEDLQAKLDEANERIAELEGGDGAPEPLEVPDDVTPGITPGWPIDAVTGDPLVLTEEQRAELAEIAPEGTEEEPVLAIVTAQGEFVVIDGPEAPAASETTEGGSGEAEPEKQAEPGDELPDGVEGAGGGWYVLPDGTKVQGRKAVDEALAS